MARNVDNFTAFVIETNQHIDSIDKNNDAFFLCNMSIIIFRISSLCYFLVGWAFAYGEPGNWFIGHGQFALNGMNDYYFKDWFFQFVFAAAASTIVSGALAERCEFGAYIAYCILLTSFVYPVITHWVWSPNGWLNAGVGILKTGVGMKDFAGSGVVHLHGGVCALVGATLLGPRIGRFPKNQPPVHIRGHSVPFAALGGFMLMFGFFAFNGGSQLTITKNGDGQVVALAMVNTMLSGGSAAVTGLLFNKFLLSKRYSLLLSINNALAGMVAICSGCDAVYPWASVVTGMGAAVICIGISMLMIKLKIDDPLDAVAVHLGGGIWGLLSSPFLIRTGIFYGGKDSGLVLAMNCIGILAIFVWSAVTIGALFFLLKKAKLFRVSPEVEMNGLDRAKHGEDAYPLLAYGHGWDEDNISGNPQVIYRSGLPVDKAWPSQNNYPIDNESQKSHRASLQQTFQMNAPSRENGQRATIENGKTNNIDRREVRVHPQQRDGFEKFVMNGPSRESTTIENSKTNSVDRRELRVHPRQREVYNPAYQGNGTYPAISPRTAAQAYPGWYSYYR